MRRRLLEALRAVREYPRRLRDLERLRAWHGEPPVGWPPGHYYSPVPSLADVRRREAQIFDLDARTVPGVDLNEAGQLATLDHLARYYPEQPFGPGTTPGRRYFFENPYFQHGEALVLFGIMRHVRPRRVVEIGSGYSSCAFLDVNELHFGNRIACTFIDPEPERLLAAVKPGDLERHALVPAPVQDVDPGLFGQLAAGDILFVDSSHVSKVGSDVNHVLFRVLPGLASGVYIHFHDIFYPFEYPREWIYEGRMWNEAYLLRAFLQYNAAFEIVFFNSYVYQLHPERLGAAMPLAMTSPGTSIWLRKR